MLYISKQSLIAYFTTVNVSNDVLLNSKRRADGVLDAESCSQHTGCPVILARSNVIAILNQPGNEYG